jgi:hypothetical protein
VSPVSFVVWPFHYGCGFISLFYLARHALTSTVSTISASLVAQYFFKA